MLVFTISLLAMALMPLAVTGTNLAFPEIERSFDGSTRAVLSWALSGYSIAIAAFQLLGGQLSDRFDAKRMFLIGLGVFAGASAIAGGAPNEGVLIAGRALQGAGGALIVPASLVLTTAQYSEDRHPMVIGIWTASFPLGAAVAPSIAAVLLEYASWRWVFFATAIAAGTVGLTIAPLRVRLPHRRPAPTQQADYFGAVLGTAAVGLLTLGIVQATSWGWASLRTLGVLASSALLVPIFIFRSLAHPRPLMNLRLFQARSYSTANIANVFISIAGMATWLVWPLVMSNEWGYSQIKVGLAITPTPVIAGAVSILSMRWARNHGHRTLLLGGSALLVVANIWYVLALEAEPDYAGSMLPGLLLYGFGMGLTFAPVNAAALIDVPAESYGQANAGFSTGRFVSAALGIAATIAALGDGGGDPFDGYDRAFTLLAIVSVLSVLTVGIFYPRSTRHPDES